MVKACKFAFISFLLLIVCACNGLREEVFSEATSDTFFQSEEELISGLGVAYNSLYGYMAVSGFWGANEVTTDELVVPRRARDWGSGHWVRAHNHRWNGYDPIVDQSWKFLFAGVNTCNRLIFQFEEIDNDLTGEFIAELRGLKAIYYLWLMDSFGNVPILKSFADSGELPVNNSRKEVYEYVEQELFEVLDKTSMQNGGEYYGRINQFVLQTALAKLYLNAEVYTGKAEWEKSLNACNAVINSGFFSLETDYFSNFNVNNQSVTEAIWAIPYDEAFAGGMNIVIASLHYASSETYRLQAQPWNGYTSLEDFYNSYEDEDLRKGKPSTEEGPSVVRGNFVVGPQWDSSGKNRILDFRTPAHPDDPDGLPVTFRPKIRQTPYALDEEGARIGKWEIEIGGGPNMNNDMILFRYADVLLMKAEALWRMNPSDGEALALVNEIRARAGVAPFTVLDAENLLAERGREMFAEAVRRSDMIRFGVWGDAWWGKEPSEPFREIFPIPETQLKENKNLVQNPGY